MNAIATSGPTPHLPDAGGKPLLATIVISTYRRLDVLGDALASMRRMLAPAGVTYELLVIDNDDRQSARELVAESCCDWPAAGTVRYLHEARPGLCHVRNRGLDEAQGDIIAFLDDDIFIDEHWLEEIVACFARRKADCVHGRTRVYWDGEPEPIVRACFGGDGGSGEIEVRRKWIPGGGNMALLRSIAVEGFRFSDGLGRVGNILLSGEDTELSRRLLDSGKHIWYCGTAVMNHRTGGRRLEASYYALREYWFGLSFALIDRKLKGKAHEIASALSRLAYAVFVALPSWFIALVRRDAVKQMKLKLFVARQLGYMRAAFFPLRIAAPASPKLASSKSAPPAIEPSAPATLRPGQEASA